MIEYMRLRGEVWIELFGPDGRQKDLRHFSNLICTAGKNQVLKATSAEYLNQFSYIAIGTSSTAASASDTALGSEVARANSTVSNPTSSSLQFQVTFGAGTGTGAIQESGLFDAASSGNLLAHQTFSVVNKGSSDTLQITWQLT